MFGIISVLEWGGWGGGGGGGGGREREGET